MTYVINNRPKHNFSVLRQVRGQLEHRATWLAMLADEAVEHGADPQTFGKAACFRCGCMQGKDMAEGKGDFTALRKKLFTPGARLVFEMKLIESTPDKLSVDFHYCPLVAAWQKMGLSNERIAQLCDIAMSGDRGIASQFGGRLDLKKVIAKGDDVCQIRFVKDNAKATEDKKL